MFVFLAAAQIAAAAQNIKRLPGTEHFAYEKKPFFPEAVHAAAEKTKVKITKEEHKKDPTKSEYYIEVDNKRRSFWHDVPYKPFGKKEEKDYFHFICEIPKGTTAKMEISKDFEWNPIVQDRKKGAPRYYKYKPEVGSLVNYGSIPQTWERPDVEDARTGIGGDNDPIDVIQVDEKPCTIGEIQRVRVLGSFALIDDGETDWKVIVTNVDDPAHKDGDLDTVVSKQRQEEILSWFRLYKTAEGKGENTIALDGKIFDAQVSREIIQENYKNWQELTRKRTDMPDEMAAMMNKMKADKAAKAAEL
jgi:inorganic pyrophosphatase